VCRHVRDEVFELTAVGANPCGRIEALRHRFEPLALRRQTNNRRGHDYLASSVTISGSILLVLMFHPTTPDFLYTFSPSQYFICCPAIAV
jgi:hypothetical protein